MRRVAVSLLAIALAVLGYFFFGIVVAIYAGLWLHNEKMFYAQGIPAQLFGFVRSFAGVFLTWLIWRFSTRAVTRR